jgi:hypothetical protein
VRIIDTKPGYPPKVIDPPEMPEPTEADEQEADDAIAWAIAEAARPAVPKSISLQEASFKDGWSTAWETEARGPGGRWESGGGGGTATAEFPPISAATVAGTNSPAVSAEEFQKLAGEGKAYIDEMKAGSSPTTALDDHWGDIKAETFTECQKSWGGQTIDTHTGLPMTPTSGYALTIRPFGTGPVSVPEDATRAEFDAAMDQARQNFAEQLAYRGAGLGVFHDDGSHTIDIDPVTVVGSLHDVATVGSYTHAVGGAYNFADGNGYWPPHVEDKAEKAGPSTPEGGGAHHWKGMGEWYAYCKKVQPNHTGKPLGTTEEQS